MSRQKRFAPEQIIAMLREADVRLSHGERVAGICSSFGISEQSYYRWRRQYGGLRIDQAQKMKRLERENARLRRVLSSLSVGSGLLGQGSNKD
ncbi:MAG: transposase [Alphaproteobacteria bacterium]